MINVALLHFCFEDYTIELANSLANYVNLTLVQPEPIAATCQKMLNPNVQVRTFSKPRIRDPRNIRSMSAMMRIIRELQPDVLHVQETNDPWYDLTLLFNSMPPLITTIHDVFRHPGDRHSVFGSDQTKRISFYRSQKLIVHTQSLKQMLVSQFKINSDKVCVLPHGELGSLYLRQAQKRSFPREPHTLLFFGRIWPYKGLKYLIEALPLVTQQIPKVKLIIAGQGEDPKTYLPQGYNEDQYEVLNGFIAPNDVISLFQRSTAVILPYTEASQSGVATLAFALGTPIIASDVGGLSEMIHPGKDGLLVPPGNVPGLANAIIKLLKDQDLQQRLKQGGLSRCEEDLNWSTIAEQTTELYYRIMR